MQQIFKNPYLNSIFAQVYIFAVALVMRYVGKPDTPDNFFTPIAVLSLFVLSASIMGFLLLGQPLQLYIDGEKKQAVRFFMKTVITFAVMTAGVVLAMSVSVK
ncbi:MAG: hypothetical protein JNN11_03230 [Candidatus Doudnabacteria bacterium]|nr:hypothetical protein [Candidatus Doudnabacteria bacterium]